LKEIILIDDGSDKPYLQQPLDDYLKFLPKVKLLRQPERMGLVKARLRGAEACAAETFTVLDSHIEVQEGWLEPLMYGANLPSPPLATTCLHSNHVNQYGGWGARGRFDPCIRPERVMMLPMSNHELLCHMPVSTAGGG
jgi:polypeptide N-acetylgalactosaminyltransferase